jgi:cellulose synthase/poly-beta-1,6-N-acetylglucosamine synthase-like glycosyltransferase
MLISLVIPSRDNKDPLSGLLTDISQQDGVFETEIIRVTGLHPASRARNSGAKNAKGRILVFIDSDIRLGGRQFLSGLLRPLLETKGVGMSCASIRIPPGASGFQRRYAREMPHAESPEVYAVTDVSVASSACSAIWREVFFSVGGFDERINRGEDSLLSLQIKKTGQRVVLAPHTFCFHPQPDSIAALMKIQFRNGLGAASVDILHPELNIDVDPRGITYDAAHKTVQERTARFMKSFYRAMLERKILLTAAKLFYLFGYGCGIAFYALYVHFKRKKTG